MVTDAAIRPDDGHSSLTTNNYIELTMAAPLGNQNAAKAKIWHAAIMRALDRRTQSRADGKKEIDALAEKLLDLVSEGDLPALKEFGDRIDGKPAQAIVGPDGGPIETHNVTEIVTRGVVPAGT